MKKVVITIEGPYLEVMIDGIVQDQVKLVKLDAVVINGVALSLKSLITPQNPFVQRDAEKEPNGPEAKRA